MKLIHILEAFKSEPNIVNASYFTKDGRKNNSIYRIMSLDELSSIYADDWSGFLSFEEDTEGSINGKISEYQGFSHFKSFAYKISRQQFNDWLDDNSVIVEFDLNAIANLTPSCKLVPYVFEKDGTKEYELRLLGNSYNSLGKVGNKAVNAIKMVYIPMSRVKKIVSELDDYFDRENGEVETYTVIKGI